VGGGGGGGLKSGRKDWRTISGRGASLPPPLAGFAYH